MPATFLNLTDDILRARPSVIDPAARTSLFRLIWPQIVFGCLYGATMGAYNGFSGDRLLQVLYSAVKVPLMLNVAFVISLPSFFVLNTLAGLREDFGPGLRALVATQAGLTIILASLAPVTAVWYISFENYPAAILFNMLIFAIACVLAQITLRRHYRPLIARRPRHRLMLKVWLLTYAFVAIQMGWVLRPFIGAPNTPVTFFRDQAWSNAYVKVYQIICSVF